MKRLMIAGLLAGSTLLMGQDNNRPRTESQGQAERTEKPSVTLARVKEFNPGKKLVLDVDNSIDKSFDLTQADPEVRVAGGLKVGDPVKVTETSMNGKKTVNVALDSEGGAQHGDKDRPEEKR